MTKPVEKEPRPLVEASRSGRERERERGRERGRGAYFKWRSALHPRCPADPRTFRSGFASFDTPEAQRRGS
jgi:hypothetical protein